MQTEQQTNECRIERGKNVNVAMRLNFVVCKNVRRSRSLDWHQFADSHHPWIVLITYLIFLIINFKHKHNQIAKSLILQYILWSKNARCLALRSLKIRLNILKVFEKKSFLKGWTTLLRMMMMIWWEKRNNGTIVRILCLSVFLMRVFFLFAFFLRTAVVCLVSFIPPKSCNCQISFHWIVTPQCFWFSSAAFHNQGILYHFLCVCVWCVFLGADKNNGSHRHCVDMSAMSGRMYGFFIITSTHANAKIFGRPQTQNDWWWRNK